MKRCGFSTMPRSWGALLGMLALACSAEPRLAERPLAEVGTIAVPSSLKSEPYAGYDGERMNRVAYRFTSTRFSVWPGGIVRYKQLLMVSVMAADASEAEYALTPRGMDVIYEQTSKRQVRPLGPGQLTTTEGQYYLGDNYEPAVQYVYVDKAKRLQIAWHAVKREIDVAQATAALTQMAASFRLARDPVAVYAEARTIPVRQAQKGARNRATVQAMLKREGFGPLLPGRPQLRNGVYLEWMADPEPRYQLLVPLGRVRVPANGTWLARPRPLTNASGIGWREHKGGEWEFSNHEHAYLPMDGLANLLAARQQDTAYVYFYYAATVRVEEEDDDKYLTTLDWFLSGVPEVQRLWRQGLLVGPGAPERD